MAWRETLRPGSFRGVPFFVRDTANEGGRRLVEHAFAGRDEPFNEDLGRAARGFQVEAYVLGERYMAARDALLTALEEAGPGKLIHPWRGEIDVVVRDYRQSETTAEGGMARFSIAFREQGANLYPRASSNTRSVVRAETDGTIAAAGTRFEDVFEAVSQPGFIAESAVFTTIRAADAMLRQARRLITEPAALARFARDVAGLKNNAASLVASPGDFFGRVSGTIRGLADMSFAAGLPLAGVASGAGSPGGRAGAALSGLQDFGDTLDPVPATTPARATEGANQTALADAIADVSAAEEARLASALEFDNASDARRYRDALAERLAARAARAGDIGAGDLHAAMTGLRAATTHHLTRLARGLPSVRLMEPAATEPALAIANRLYGDDPSEVASRAADIVLRNRVRHPGFVPGGRPLEVVANG